MGGLITDPEFLRLAMRAQESFSKVSRMEHAIEGQLLVSDMLDMLAEELDGGTPRPRTGEE